MWRAGIIRAIVVAGLALLSAGGCASSSRVGQAGSAATPQDKAHQEQLTDLSRQDAEAAEGSQKKRETPPASSQRRTGQKVVDQPIRR